MSIVLVIILFGLMIFVHELGHFITSKLSGVKVEQFTIGFGPAIIKKKVGDTLYAIRLLPIGGAVMMKGETDEEEILVGKNENKEKDPSDTEGSFYAASPLKRILICLAGSAMNLISGILILVILFLPVSQVYSSKLEATMEGFAYYGDDGFLEGDKIVSINGFHIYVYGDISTALALGEGRPFDFTILRNGKRIVLKDLPLERKIYDESDPDNPKYGFIFGVESLSALGRVSYAFKNAASFLQSAFKSIGLLVSGRAKTSDMMGTIGIASEMNKRAKTSLSDLWYFVAFISVNLAFVNLLPIPGLDGGKILFVLIELIVGRKLNPKFESYFSIAGLILILALFVFISYHDVVRLLS